VIVAALPEKGVSMLRAIRFLGVLPLLFVSGTVSSPLEIADADAIANWPAPAF